jgi:hypothetical protein
MRPGPVSGDGWDGNGSVAVYSAGGPAEIAKQGAHFADGVDEIDDRGAHSAEGVVEIDDGVAA